MTRKIYSVALGVAALLLVAPLSAGALNLTYDDTLKDIQQTDNSPCVIGSPSCDNTLPYTTVPGGPGDQNLSSPTYTVGQLTGILGTSLVTVLIDVNQSGGTAETDPISLDVFQVFIGGVLTYSLFPVPQTVPLTGSLSGNGFSDAGMTGLDLTGLDPSTTVVFHAEWSDATNGQESFFLRGAEAVPCDETPEGCPPLVPEPTSLLLLGSGLTAVGWRVGRKRNRPTTV
jgi:hypothetical protein